MSVLWSQLLSAPSGQKRSYGRFKENSWNAFPSIFFCFFGTGMRWQQVKQGSPDVPLPSNAFPLLPGDPEAFSREMRYIIPPACSGYIPGCPTSWTSPENFQRRMPRRNPHQMPKPPQWLYSELPLDVWAPYPISQVEPSHPTETQLAACIRNLILF